MVNTFSLPARHIQPQLVRGLKLQTYNPHSVKAAVRVVVVLAKFHAISELQSSPYSLRHRMTDIAANRRTLTRRRDRLYMENSILIGHLS